VVEGAQEAGTEGVEKRGKEVGGSRDGEEAEEVAEGVEVGAEEEVGTEARCEKKKISKKRKGY
jgi:hypothetical protein